jgi:NADPH-dependent 2,4-dienoyl-CoA reductase/sulfur reductase-like enzyme
MNDNEYFLEYDTLILSPGASPIVPPIKGLDKVPAFVLRNIPHCIGMEEYVSTNNPKSAVVIGGGFIGLEVAENLIERGVMVTIIELLDQVMMPLDKEMAQLVHQELLMNGVDLILGDGVKEFDKKGNGKLIVKTQSDKIIETDMIVLSIGIKPENRLAVDAKLELGPKGHIVVNDHMLTSDPNIYAIGDVVQIKDYITKENTAVPLAGPANQQGRIVADKIAGINSVYNGATGVAVLKLFRYYNANVDKRKTIAKFNN